MKKAVRFADQPEFTKTTEPAKQMFAPTLLINEVRAFSSVCSNPRTSCNSQRSTCRACLSTTLRPPRSPSREARSI